MGKSTLLKTIMGFLRAEKGRITLFGSDILGCTPQDIARQGVAYVPQEAAIFQDLTVEENLRLALVSDRYLKRGIDKISIYFPIIPERRRQKAGTLSGGEQKMLLMARALIGEPRLMLIDEISEGLQPTMVGRMAKVLQRITREEGVTVLLVEQNVRLVSQVADALGLIKIGRLVEEQLVDDESRDEQALVELMRV